MVETYIGIGSNLGDRRDLCARALGLLGMLPQSRLVGYSPAYETEPVGDVGGPFLNLVARVDTDLPAWRLLLILRERSGGWAATSTVLRDHAPWISTSCSTETRSSTTMDWKSRTRACTSAASSWLP